MKRLCLGFIVSFLSATGYGQELTWDSFRAFGGGDGVRCQYDENNPDAANTYLDAFGPNATFVFDSFGIDLPRVFGGGKLDYEASCNIEAFVTIPQGHYIETLSQTILFSVKKGRGALGGVSTNGFLFQDQIPINQINLEFLPDERVDTDLADRSNTQIFDPIARALQCAATALGPLKTKFKFQMLAIGVRPLPFIEFVTNIDSGDFTFELQPTIRRCG
ncbi:MAG: hypothetical protein HRU19_16010 [Pseudobacteriovorax sp.]|nr:hypothetical protein [Pseudobacteriovorax sp.]